MHCDCWAIMHGGGVDIIMTLGNVMNRNNNAIFVVLLLPM